MIENTSIVLTSMRVKRPTFAKAMVEAKEEGSPSIIVVDTFPSLRKAKYRKRKSPSREEKGSYG